MWLIFLLLKQLQPAALLMFMQNCQNGFQHTAFTVGVAEQVPFLWKFEPATLPIPKSECTNRVS